VAEHGSFSAAAARLYVSQPAVSKQISMFESELGFRLFSRMDRRIQLTENGRLMYEELRRCVDGVTALIEDIRQSSASFEGEMRIGCVEMWNASVFFMPLRDYFSEHHPQVSLSVEAYSPASLVAALKRGEIDIALSYERTFAGQSDVFPTHIKTLECGLLYSRSYFNPKAEGGPYNFDGVPVLIGSDESNVFPRMAEHVFYKYGLLCEKCEGRRMSSIVMDAFCGRGVMLVTEWNHLVDNSAFGYRPIGREFPVSAAYMRSESGGQKLFLINEAVWTLKKACSASQ